MVEAFFKSHPARAAAKAAGEKLFDPGQPCTEGHQAMRYVKNGACVDCMAADLWAASNDRPPSEWRRKFAFLPGRRKQEIIERPENKPPMIGADNDDDAATPSLTAQRLIKA